MPLFLGISQYINKCYNSLGIGFVLEGSKETIKVPFVVIAILQFQAQFSDVRSLGLRRPVYIMLRILKINELILESS